MFVSLHRYPAGWARLPVPDKRRGAGRAQEHVAAGPQARGAGVGHADHALVPVGPAGRPELAARPVLWRGADGLER